MCKFFIRNIEKEDNEILAKIIRESLLEFKANKPGTVYFDVTTDNLFNLFKMPKSNYFVALQNNEVVGGAGIYPTDKLPINTCEFVKLYIHKSARGLGLGKLLINKCIAFAKQNGYSKIYLETMTELSIAVPLYEKMGFKYLDKPLGNSGHCDCNIWMEFLC